MSLSFMSLKGQRFFAILEYSILMPAGTWRKPLRPQAARQWPSARRRLHRTVASEFGFYLERELREFLLPLLGHLATDQQLPNLIPPSV